MSGSQRPAGPVEGEKVEGGQRRLKDAQDLRRATCFRPETRLILDPMYSPFLVSDELAPVVDSVRSRVSTGESRELFQMLNMIPGKMHMHMFNLNWETNC